jgi:predicted aspartyl protease
MIVRLLLLFIAMLSAEPAVAACELRQRAVVTLEVAGALMLAPVTVNGIPGSFILDTGAAQTVVTPEAVDRFNLALDEWTATTMRGVGGIERRRNAVPRTVELGGVALHRRSLAQDATLRVASLKLSVVGGQRVDGLLGRDFLSAFDLDLDFSQRKLTLYEVRGCTGWFLPWTELYSSIPVQNPTESAILVPVELDGVRLHALLDSGASETLVAAPGMVRLGLGLDRLHDDPHQIASGVGPHSVTMWHHRFQTLQIGDEAVASPVFLVAPIQLNPISDMLLGADWFLGRRVWISYSTDQLFVGRGR